MYIWNHRIASTTSTSLSIQQMFNLHNDLNLSMALKPYLVSCSTIPNGYGSKCNFPRTEPKGQSCPADWIHLTPQMGDFRI